MGGEYDVFHLHDDISSDLDIAMMVRRQGIEGNDTPEGILTRFKETHIGNLISQIEQLEELGTIDLGFMLLLLGEDTENIINDGIKEITQSAYHDQNSHDLTVSMGEASAGLTIHSNKIPIAGPKLEQHAERRKYSQKANKWFGINIWYWIKSGMGTIR